MGKDDANNHLSQSFVREHKMDTDDDEQFSFFRPASRFLLSWFKHKLLKISFCA